jgi:hypothetical protein
VDAVDEAAGGRGDVPAVCPNRTQATDKIAKLPNMRTLFVMMDGSDSRTYEFKLPNLLR